MPESDVYCAKSNNCCYLAISSNVGDRKRNIENAIGYLKSDPNIQVNAISSTLEYPALYKGNSKCENILLHYLNVVVKIDFKSDNPYELLAIVQEIERKIGKNTSNKTVDEKDFNSRLIDIDILLFKDLKLSEKYLIIPHYDLLNRSFFIDLLCQLDSNITIDNKNILEIRRGLSLKNSFLIQIININNNSLSSDGIMSAKSDSSKFSINYKALKKTIRSCIKNNVPIIDIGVISTAPYNPKILFSIDEEIEMLKSTLDVIYEEFKKSKYLHLLPKISIDTFRYEVIKSLLDDHYHFDIINSQNAFDDKRNFDLFKNTHHKIILMHSLSLPVNREIQMIGDLNAICKEIKDFFKIKKDIFIQKNIDTSRLIIDPGIGFGKTPEQSIFLLKNIETFFDLNLQIIIGHSRKSFISYKINSKQKQNPKGKDFDTSIISGILNQKGIEFLRVHNYKINKDTIFLNLSMKNY